jgi:hypothetical protein
MIGHTKMSPGSITVLHIQGQGPSEVEQALESAFAGEQSRRRLRIEGTFSACLQRITALEDEASYRYLICRPPHDTPWTPVLELGSRSAGLEALLSRSLGGSAVFTVFVYGELISGYRLARYGTYVDRYTSDPSALFAPPEAGSPADTTYEEDRGHPERFADLLPLGTDAEDFTRIVLRPGWWEEHDQPVGYALPESGTNYEDVTEGDEEEEGEEEDEELVEAVDERDRMRCIALALELWGPSEYPFAQDAEDIPNRAGPAIAVAFT